MGGAEVTEWKPVRLRRGRLVHVTADLQETACGWPCSGAVYAVDEATNCKKCLRVQLDDPELN